MDEWLTAFAGVCLEVTRFLVTLWMVLTVAFCGWYAYERWQVRRIVRRLLRRG